MIDFPKALRKEFPRLDVVDLGAFGGRWSYAKTAWLNDQTLTLIASAYGIADTEMPVIRQEEERRKRRVATRVAAGALMLVVVLSALLAFALVQRQRAEQRRVQAVVAQKDAEIQRNIAEQRRVQAVGAQKEAETQRNIAEDPRWQADAACHERLQRLARNVSIPQPKPKVSASAPCAISTPGARSRH